eukprot:c25885_g1_i1 orf=1073-2902(+)
MNPSVNPTDEQGDPSWPSESWDQSVATVSCGLDPRQIQQNRLQWDWESPMILAQHSNACAGDQEADCKPNIMADAIGTSLRQYNGLLPTAFPSSLPHNAWGMLNATGLLRNGGENMDGCSHTLQAASAPFYASLESSGLSGFPNAKGNLGDARASFDQQRQLFGLVSMDQRQLQDIAKREICSPADFSARLGLNLGRRTYFSAGDSSLARFGKRHRPNSPGAQAPMCQAEGCKADLSVAKHYHRRHKVCDFHSKSATVTIGGQTQRFCQQCSRFHVLSEFDEGKRSCRKRLADHNRRRRKPQANSTATSGSSTAESAAHRSVEMELNRSTNEIGNGTKTKRMDKSESHALLSAMNLTSTVPLVMQNEKRHVPTLSAIPEKELAYQQFLQPGCTSPNLSLSTRGVGGATAAVTTQRQSPAQSFEELAVTVPWLRHVGSRSSNLMENVTSSSVNAVSDKSNPHRQFLELGGSTSNMQAISQSFQNLLSLQPNSKNYIGNSDHWMMKTLNGQGSESLLDFASRSLSSSGQSHNQEVLSLLESGTVQEVQNSDSHCQQNVLLEFMQQQLPSAANVNEVSDGHSVTGNRHEIEFQGQQVLRSFNQSVYNTQNIL